MPRLPYRDLRIALGLLSVFAAVAGLLLIFGGKSLLIRIFLHPPESEVSTLLLFTMKEMGGFAFMLSLLLFFACRNPARNIAIIDAVVVGLCILAITPLLALYTLDIRHIYPDYLIWVRSLIRLALAALLYYLRRRTSLEYSPR